MQFRGLATDIDGTLTDGKTVPAEMRRALREARRLRPDLLIVGVTGRSYDCFEEQRPDSDHILSGVEHLFDAIVCDNGGTIRFPVGSKLFPQGHTMAIGSVMPPEVYTELRARGVTPLWEGLTMIASVTEGNDGVIRSTLRRLKVTGVRRELNKDWVMYQTSRPDGHFVDKAVGFRVACQMLGVRPRDMVGTGDGENDISFLRICGLSVALANAKPGLKDVAKFVSPFAAWRGTRDVLSWLVGHNLAANDPPQRSIAA